MSEPSRFIEVTKKITPTGPELYLRTCERDWTSNDFYDWLYQQGAGGISGAEAERMDPYWHRHPALNLHHMHAHTAPHAHEPTVEWGQAFPIPEGMTYRGGID